MFRSTHDKLVKSLKDDYEDRINAIKQRADQQVKHDEARVQAERTQVLSLDALLKKAKDHAISKAFNRDPRDVADTLVRALYSVDNDIVHFDYPCWEELPEEYRKTFYDIVYKLLGKPRKSSKKSTKNSV